MPRYEYKYRKPQRRRFPVRWVALGLVLAALAAWPFVEATLLSVEEHTLEVANLPANLRNLKIVFASDIHRCAWFSRERVEDVFQTINNLSPDLILLGGDYATDSDSAIAFFRDMPALHARLGVYAVVGNHDRTAPENNLNTLMKQMRDSGVTPLVNSVSAVRVGQAQLYLAGVDDYYNGFPDVAGVAAQVRAEDFVIFVGHTPDLMPDVLKAEGADGDNHWFDLALFGHTHGGQINLMGYTPFSNLSPEVGARYLSGWREENRAAVLVSNGVGTSGLPVRLFSRPQVHLITLKAR